MFSIIAIHLGLWAFILGTIYGLVRFLLSRNPHGPADLPAFVLIGLGIIFAMMALYDALAMAPRPWPWPL